MTVYITYTVDHCMEVSVRHISTGIVASVNLWRENFYICGYSSKFFYCRFFTFAKEKWRVCAFLGACELDYLKVLNSIRDICR